MYVSKDKVFNLLPYLIIFHVFESCTELLDIVADCNSGGNNNSNQPKQSEPDLSWIQVLFTSVFIVIVVGRRYSPTFYQAPPGVTISPMSLFTP